MCSENNIPLTDGQDGLKMANKKIDIILFELFSYKKSQFCHFWFLPENIYTTLPLICCIIFDSPFLFFFLSCINCIQTTTLPFYHNISCYMYFHFFYSGVFLFILLFFFVTKFVWNNKTFAKTWHISFLYREAPELPLFMGVF